jgi:hypothetical protein
MVRNEMVTFDYVGPYPCPTGRLNLFVVAGYAWRPAAGEVDVVLRLLVQMERVEMDLYPTDAPTITFDRPTFCPNSSEHYPSLCSPSGARVSAKLTATHFFVRLLQRKDWS